MTTTTLDALAPLAARLATLAEQAETIRDEMDTIKQRIRDAVPGPDTYTAGNLAVVVSTNNRFNPAKALTLVPAELAPLVIDMVPTVAKDRLKALAPALYEQALTIGEYKIGIR